jgi:hypothetical protein
VRGDYTPDLISSKTGLKNCSGYFAPRYDFNR